MLGLCLLLREQSKLCAGCATMSCSISLMPLSLLPSMRLVAVCGMHSFHLQNIQLLPIQASPAMCILQRRGSISRSAHRSLLA